MSAMGNIPLVASRRRARLRRASAMEHTHRGVRNCSGDGAEIDTVEMKGAVGLARHKAIQAVGSIGRIMN